MVTTAGHEIATVGRRSQSPDVALVADEVGYVPPLQVIGGQNTMGAARDDCRAVGREGIGQMLSAVVAVRECVGTRRGASTDKAPGRGLINRFGSAEAPGFAWQSHLVLKRITRQGRVIAPRIAPGKALPV